MIESASNSPYASDAFLSVGVDVAADEAWMAIVAPNGSPVGKPFRMVYNDSKSREKVLTYIEEAQEKYSLKARFLLESTGVYHEPLMRFLGDHGYTCSLINPIITKNTTNVNIRKVHSDLKDAQRIAKLGLDTSVKISLIPDDTIKSLRELVRNREYAVKEKTAAVLKLTQALKTSFPLYLGIFGELDGKASLAFLEKYPTPQIFLESDKQEVIDLIRTASRRGEKFAVSKYAKIMAAAEDALNFGVVRSSTDTSVRELVAWCNAFQKSIDNYENRLCDLVQASEDAKLRENVKLLQTMPGIGFLSAVTLLAEIGDIDAFKHPKQVKAFFGLDPGVRQSGKFKADNCHISKRGSAIARRVLHSIAVQNVRVDKVSGIAVNPPMREYYDKLLVSKKKSVALGAVSAKCLRIIFAMLRDNKPFEARSAEDHRKAWEQKQLKETA